MRPENNTKKMCFYKFVATLLLSLTHKTSKTLQINRLHQIKNILHRKLTFFYILVFTFTKVNVNLVITIIQKYFDYFCF